MSEAAGRSSSRATRTRRTRSASAAPTRRGTLLEYGDAGERDGGLAELARTFEGAWPYLTLIAEREPDRGSARPAGRRGVLGRQRASSTASRRPTLARHVEERFRGRLGRAGERIPSIVAAGAVPHHCFHVFALYPWLGLLRSGIADEPLRVLDQCRTTPALVLSVEGESAEVLAEPLLWEDGRLRLGEPARRRVRWRDGGRAFARPQPGELVSLHWDFVCDVLTAEAAARLARGDEARAHRGERRCDDLCLA